MSFSNKLSELCLQKSKPIQCYSCHKIFSNYENLEYHSQLCLQKSKPIQCYRCHKIFSNYENLEYHLTGCTV